MAQQITRDDIGLTPLRMTRTNSLTCDEVRDEAERTAVVTALGRANGNLARAAEILGISRPTLYDIMHRVGLR